MTDAATRGGPRWRWVAALALLAVAGQLWGLYRVSGPPTPDWFPHLDKIEHALGFAVPVALLALALGLRRRASGRAPSAQTLAAVAALFAAHAVLSEIVQHAFYASRTGDPFDVVADWIGVAVGALVARALLRRPARRSPAAAPTSVPGRTGIGTS